MFIKLNLNSDSCLVYIVKLTLFRSNCDANFNMTEQYRHRFKTIIRN